MAKSRSASFPERHHIGIAHEECVRKEIETRRWEVIDCRIEHNGLSPRCLRHLRDVGINFAGRDFLAYRPPADLIAVDAKTAMPADQDPLPGFGKYHISAKSADGMQAFTTGYRINGFFVLGDLMCVTWRQVRDIGYYNAAAGYYVICSNIGVPFDTVFGLPGGEWPGDWPQAA